MEYINNIVTDVMNMGNIVPRAVIEPISLAFQASMLTITPHMLPDVTITPMPTCLLRSSPWHCKPFNTYNYIHTGSHLTYIYTG